eukprot:scaffold6090_cov129-Skeletonema_dohrnii-CCMP3373.AAC.3
MAAVTTANRKDCRGYYDNIRRLLNPQPFANFILGLIFINSIMMGIATFPFVKDDDDLRYKFDLVDQIFLIIFTIESAMQLLYFGLRGFFRDGFRVFDLLIVILSWAMEGTQDSWSTIMKQIQEEYPTAWIPFVIFIILTGFVVVNLIIAVICDAVSILGGVDNNAGLSAYAAEDGRPREFCIDGANYNVIEQKVEGGGKPSSQLCATTAQRLEELQKQLDDLVVAQDQMRRTVKCVSQKEEEELGWRNKIMRIMNSPALEVKASDHDV